MTSILFILLYIPDIMSIVSILKTYIHENMERIVFIKSCMCTQRTV